ncbi:MAG: J domain-containing protein [Melioribacteraceae bacterium]|nr:MAG: J domain-containing protein [Melioribacteraceae bacterium]
MKYMDYYKILGVAREADEKEIKKAYRQLARQYHPDMNPNNEQAAERFKEINEAWKPALLDKAFRTKMIVSVLLLAIALFFLARFLPYNETRPGFSLDDPLLKTFNPIDLTWITFILIYGALVVGLASLAKYPRRILIAFQSYTLVASLRLITIYFLPFNAPPDIIPMKDPFVEFFGGGQTLLRDLFFSGHTATMFL